MVLCLAACEAQDAEQVIIMSGKSTLSTSSAQASSKSAKTTDDPSDASSGATSGASGEASWELQAEESGVDPTYEAMGVINGVRAEAGLGSLVQNKLLDLAAQAHATFISEHFTLYSQEGVSLYVEPADVEGSQGETPIDRMTAAGYTGVYAAELIAFKHTPTAAVHSWLETLYQRLRLLDPNVSEMGLGWSVVDGYTIHIIELGSHE